MNILTFYILPVKRIDTNTIIRCMVPLKLGIISQMNIIIIKKR